MLKLPIYFRLIANFKVFLLHLDGGSIVYRRGRGVLLIDALASPMTLPSNQVQPGAGTQSASGPIRDEAGVE